jgi:murein DD-endopeptidase
MPTQENPLSRKRIGVLEAFGLRPLGSALRESRQAVGGSRYIPRTQFGLSSLRIFKPRISIPTWLGVRRRDRQVPIYNLFNRVPAPRNEGYSVRLTYARDFLGGQWTYDGHLGTDFAVPVGTPVVATAPGRVMKVVRFLDHGGLKVCIDHGAGLFTTSDHLARTLVHEGERVIRGQTIGLSGASGLEFVLFFPWVAPHLHFNVWLNGKPVDPFAVQEAAEVPLWRTGNSPVPRAGKSDDAFDPASWDEDAIEDGTKACLDPMERERLSNIPDPDRRAVELLVLQNFRSPLFRAYPCIYKSPFGRQPLLDLPFRQTDFVGMALPKGS